MIMNICVGVLVATGLYMILADRFRVPYMRTSKAINNLSKQRKKKTSSFNVWLSSFAGFIAGKIKLNEFKKAQLESDLKTAQMNVSPEMFMANTIVKSLIVGILAVPVAFIFPVLSPVVAVMAFVLYRINMKKIAVMIKKKRASIEYELPRFVFKIEKSLMHGKDVLEMIDSFAKTAGPQIKHEFEITAADMRSGNSEVAITRLEARVGSPLMSDVCRGLISINRGDVNTVYWNSLSMKFADIQRQHLRLEAQKTPKKVKRLSMCLLFCFMLIYVVVILAQIMNSVGVLFG